MKIDRPGGKARYFVVGLRNGIASTDGFLADTPRAAPQLIFGGTGSAPLRLAGDSQVDALGLRFTSVSFGAGKRQVPPN